MSEFNRDAFEAAISLESGMSVESFRNDRDGDSYSSIGPKYAWWGWQASRMTLVVDLPDLSGMAERADAGNEYAAIRIDQQAKCRVAIEAAGVTVKMKS